MSQELQVPLRYVVDVTCGCGVKHTLRQPPEGDRSRLQCGGCGFDTTYVWSTRKTPGYEDLQAVGSMADTPRGFTEIAVGDPMAVVAPVVALQAPGWQVTYTGQARSHSIGDHRWAQGETKVLTDMKVVVRAQRTPHFQVMPPRVQVKRGRVYKIYRIDPARQALQDPLSFVDKPLEEYLQQHESNYEFVLVSATGALHSFKRHEVKVPDEKEMLEIQTDEATELMAGRVPYGGRLKLVGRGKWGRGSDL